MSRKYHVIRQFQTRFFTRANRSFEVRVEAGNQFTFTTHKKVFLATVVATFEGENICVCHLIQEAGSFFESESDRRISMKTASFRKKPTKEKKISLHTFKGNMRLLCLSSFVCFEISR